MGFFKVLGGIAAGVGAVVALPVAGPIGAITLAGAAIGGAVGGTAGALASAADDEKNESSRRSGERQVTAKYQAKTEKLINALGEAEKKLKDDKEYFKLLIALFAIGLATANADGKISTEELEDLDEFVTGVGHSQLPPHVKGAVTRLKNKPPNFNTAMTHVKKLEKVDIKLFESVIEVVSASDGKVTDEERALLAAFRKAA